MVFRTHRGSTVTLSRVVGTQGYIGKIRSIAAGNIVVTHCHTVITHDRVLLAKAQRLVVADGVVGANGNRSGTVGRTAANSHAVFTSSTSPHTCGQRIHASGSIVIVITALGAVVVDAVVVGFVGIYLIT